MTLAVSSTRASAADLADVYVSVGGENRIARYVLDRTTGELRHTDDTKFAGSPGSIGADRKGVHLYVALRSVESVASVKRDPATGELTVLGVTKAAGNPVYVVPDGSDRFLLTAYYSGDKAAVFRIGSDHVVRPEAVQVLQTGKNPHSIHADPANRFVFVPNTGADRILQFQFDTDTGKLTPSEPELVPTKAGSGPRHFCFHPKLQVVYFVNEIDSTVTVCKLDNEKGTLAVQQTLSTLPEDFSKSNTCADIHVTPDGKFVYASNRGHDSLAGYQVDPESGLLTSIGQFATEKTPREFDIDSTGSFVIAAGQDSGNIVTYRLDKGTGALQPLKVQAAGKSPAWVLIMDRQ